MTKRKIVQIDESKCNGCGLCITNCAEGALEIIDGKAKLVKDIYCDGLGACLGHCPMDAIEIIERDAAEFNEDAVEERMKKAKQKEDEKNYNTQSGDIKKACNQMHAPGGGCPGSRMRVINKREDKNDSNVKLNSRLSQWPVQLKLVSANAPYFYNSDLLITADCVPFAYANYHNDFLKDRTVVVGCPKLDDKEYYTEKLEEIIKVNDLESITVLRMEVPCCGGMSMAAKLARDNSGINIPIKVVTISIEGEIIGRDYI
jgi:Fe-S-cluster-containing hydrogenase component 2